MITGPAIWTAYFYHKREVGGWECDSRLCNVDCIFTIVRGDSRVCNVVDCVLLLGGG